MSPVDSRLDAPAIELAIRSFARSPNSGLMLTPNAAAMLAGVGYKLVTALVAELKLPTIYPFSYMVVEGGLISHGVDPVEESGERLITLTASSKARSQVISPFRR